jgi:membrane associated rhomboid family serine protease
MGASLEGAIGASVVAIVCLVSDLFVVFASLTFFRFLPFSFFTRILDGSTSAWQSHCWRRGGRLSKSLLILSPLALGLINGIGSWSFFLSLGSCSVGLVMPCWVELHVDVICYEVVGSCS